MIHNNVLFSQNRGVNRTFGPVAHFVACTCASDMFLMNWKNFNKSNEAEQIARFREHAHIFTLLVCMEFVSWMDEVGIASNNEMNAKMQWIKKLRFAKYHVMHPKNEDPASKNMPVQALYANKRLRRSAGSMKQRSKARSTRHQKAKIPDGNWRSRARRIREAMSLQSPWMRGQKIKQQKRRQMLLRPVPSQRQLHKLLLRPKSTPQHSSNKMQQVPLLVVFANHPVQIPQPPRAREGGHL